MYHSLSFLPLTFSLIVEFSAGKNSFEGEGIPEAWLNHTTLKNLYLRKCGLGGALPSSLPPSLEYIDIGENEFEGEIPNEWSSSTSLIDLIADDNNLNGSLSDITLPPNLQSKERKRVKRMNIFNLFIFFF